MTAVEPQEQRVFHALQDLVYEITHLCASEPDGSHKPIITAKALDAARDALKAYADKMPVAKREMSDEPTDRAYDYAPWQDDADGAREAAAKFFGYASWEDAVERGGTHGAKVSSKLAETLREFAANATDRVWDAELRTDAAKDMVNALQSVIDEKLGPENERLRAALTRLERAGAKVYRSGARPGAQWTPFGVELALARGVLENG